MSDILEFFLTIALTSTFGAISAFTGGGGGLLGVPYFIFIGLSPVEAIGTGKFGGLGVAAGSLPKYMKANKVRKDLVWKLLPVTIVASILGPQITLNLSDEHLQLIIGSMVLLIAPLILFKKQKDNQHELPTGWRLYVGLAFYGFVATIQAAFGSGTGAILVIILMSGLGLTAIEAGATRRLAGLPMVTITALIFVLSGQVNYLLAVATMIGNFTGGRVGAKLALKKGNTWVKPALFIILVATGVKLLSN